MGWVGDWGFALAIRGILQLRLSSSGILHVTFRCSLVVSISGVCDRLFILFVCRSVSFRGIAVIALICSAFCFYRRSLRISVSCNHISGHSLIQLELFFDW